MTASPASLLVEYRGSCHCKRVQFSALASPDLVVWRCNCSICTMKKNIHFIIPSNQFHLHSGEEHLTTYTFNTHAAKHKFCSVCGVQSFYIPRSNPDGVAVTLDCLTEQSKQSLVKSVTVRDYDGLNWEKSHADSNIAVFSKKSKF